MAVMEPPDAPAERGPNVPPFPYDPVIEAYKKDVDRTLLRANLRLTPAERLDRLQAHVDFLAEIRRAGAEARRRGTLR